MYTGDSCDRRKCLFSQNFTVAPSTEAVGDLVRLSSVFMVFYFRRSLPVILLTQTLLITMRRSASFLNDFRIAGREPRLSLLQLTECKTTTTTSSCLIHCLNIDDKLNVQ